MLEAKLTPRRDLAGVGDGIPGAHVGSFGEQPRGEDDARRLTQVVGLRLEGEPEERDAASAQRAEVLLQLPDHPPLLQFVHLDHRR